MLNVGLTGGIASGKSTAARILREKGAFLVDFDDLVRRLQGRGTPLWQDIVDNFGPGILQPDGQIDRRALARVVFADEKKRRFLEGLVHPPVIALWQEQLAGLAGPGRIVISDCPLLFEAGLQNLFDLIIVVHVDPEVQLRRLTARDNLSLPEAYSRLAAQMPIRDKLPLADIVVDNNGSPDDLALHLAEVWERLKLEEKSRRT